MSHNIQAYVLQIKDMNLVDVIQSQSLQIITELFKIYDSEGRREEQLNTTDADGFTPLHKACMRGYLELIDYLLINGADCNKKNNGGENCVHIAAKRGSPVIMRMLQDKGADIEVVDNKDRGPAHHGIANDSVPVLAWLDSALPSLSLDRPDSDGLTPLHLACAGNKAGCVRFLLARTDRANPMQLVAGPSRNTCLHLAVIKPSPDVLPLLLFRNVDRYSTLHRLTRPPDDQDELDEPVHALNGDHKTPLQLYKEWPYDVSQRHKQLSFGLMALTMMSLSQLRLNLNFLRMFLFLWPGLSMLAAVAVAHLVWPRFCGPLLFAGTLMCLLLMQQQSHRCSQLDTRPNPMFMGAYLAGIGHDLLIFFTLTRPAITDWQVLLAFCLLPLLAVTYLRLLLADSGRPSLTEQLTTSFSVHLDTCMTERRRGQPLQLDRFCITCEAAYQPQLRVKHCRLCCHCLVEMDHHCLFLMRCIARNNLRSFLLLLALSVALILIFCGFCIRYLVPSCGWPANVSPLVYLLCIARQQPLIALAFLFNLPSLIWALYLLYCQLIFISYNCTYVFFSQHRTPGSLCTRLWRVLYFLATGNFYRPATSPGYVGV